jgi:lipopolysaccharide export system permease protein
MEILFITSGSIGDAIVSTGILGQLMDEYPEAGFTVAVGPAALPLFRDCPRIARTLSMFKLPLNKHWFLLWQQTKDTQWDLIVDLRSSVISYILNTHHRRIFRKPDKSLSKAEQLAALMGFSPPPPTRLWVSDEARAIARSLLPHGKTAIVLAPKTNSVFKDWPLDRFVELAHRLYKEGVIFVIMASGLQHQSLQPLFRTLPAERVLDLAGKTDLPTAYAVIEQSKLFIGNDSGLLHMAAAAKTPSVGIYGPSNDKTYAPRSENLRLVTAYDFKPGEEEKHDMGYIQKITVEQVEAAVRELGVI